MTDVDRRLEHPSDLPSPNQGKVIIFSAPSGSGKTTIVQHLLEHNPHLAFSISACTRPRRTHEIDGIHYYFLSEETFLQKINEGAFIEWQQVYSGSYYGTLRAEISRLWAQGKQVLFDVDVEGGLKLKDYFKDAALAIFVAPPSYEVLEQRLRNRDTDSEDSILERLEKARFELSFKDKFERVILNDHLDSAVQEAQDLIDHFLKQS